MFAEYGARVRIDGIDGIPDGTMGTIVSDVPLFGHAANWTIELDGSRQRITMHVTEFDVTMTPSESAYRITQHRSVDEALTMVEDIAELGASVPHLATYQSAFIFELYRLNAHAEKTLYGVPYLLATLDSERSEVTFYHVADIGWESGTCSEPDRDDGYWPQDDGYGYPVYRVED